LSHEKKFPKNAHEAMIAGVTYWKSIEFNPNIPINTIKVIGKIMKLNIDDRIIDKAVLAKIFVISTIFKLVFKIN
jgi:hypothetical protein